MAPQLRIVAVGDAAKQNDSIHVARIFGVVPDELGLLPFGGDGAAGVVIAIATRKDDDTKSRALCFGEAPLRFIRKGARVSLWKNGAVCLPIFFVRTGWAAGSYTACNDSICFLILHQIISDVRRTRAGAVLQPARHREARPGGGGPRARAPTPYRLLHHPGCHVLPVGVVGAGGIPPRHVHDAVAGERALERNVQGQGQRGSARTARERCRRSRRAHHAL